MADRSSAEIFGMVLDILAEDPTDDHKAIAKRVFEQTRHYDFTVGQMECDNSLKKLGLKR